MTRVTRGQARLAMLLVGLAALIALVFLVAVVVGLNVLPPALR